MLQYPYDGFVYTYTCWPGTVAASCIMLLTGLAFIFYIHKQLCSHIMELLNVFTRLQIYGVVGTGDT